jgi:hypothetical protein
VPLRFVHVLMPEVRLLILTMAVGGRCVAWWGGSDTNGSPCPSTPQVHVLFLLSTSMLSLLYLCLLLSTADYAGR